MGLMEIVLDLMELYWCLLVCDGKMPKTYNKDTFFIGFTGKKSNVYNGTLMETIRISVIGSIGLILCF